MQRTDIISEDTAREGRQYERDRQTRPMQRKGGVHAQDIARERQQGPRQSGQELHQEGARDGMGEQLRLGLKQRNIRETGVGPRKGKNTGESPELSKTRGCCEDHQ